MRNTFTIHKDTFNTDFLNVFIENNYLVIINPTSNGDLYEITIEQYEEERF